MLVLIRVFDVFEREKRAMVDLLGDMAWVDVMNCSQEKISIINKFD